LFLTATLHRPKGALVQPAAVRGTSVTCCIPPGHLRPRRSGDSRAHRASAAGAARVLVDPSPGAGRSRLSRHDGGREASSRADWGHRV